MLTRRQLAIGGVCSVLLGPDRSSAEESPEQIIQGGCMLSRTEAESYLARSGVHQLYVTGLEPIVQKSGNADFDFALAHTLSRITDTLEVLPGFAYYDDFDKKNAFATDSRRLANADGTVLFGLRLLREMLSGPEHPDVAVTAICAHEFGHILQFKRGLVPTILAGQSTIKRIELHADFLAGYYAGVRKTQKPDYPAAVFAMTKYSIGDNFINRPTHHGLPDERASAIVRGFEASYREKRSLSEAIQMGINYVSRI
jgi:hypothetical protein